MSSLRPSVTRLETARCALGQALAIHDKAGPDGRWAPNRKAGLVPVANAGVISLGMLIKGPSHTIVEFEDWRRRFEAGLQFMKAVLREAYSSGSRGADPRWRPVLSHVAPVAFRQ